MKKVILITGAGSGIGKDSAIALARRGHQVIATTETVAQSEALAEYIKNNALSMEIRVLDITKPTDQNIVGEYDLDVVINVAGIGESGSLAEVPLERVRQNFETNVFGTLAIVQAALKKMMQKKNGTVIVVSSVAGRLPIAFMSPYSMTKFALSGGMAALREEVHQIAPDVHISLIEPGAYGTGFNQRVFATKYSWMNEQSYFYTQIEQLKKADARFGLIEEHSTKSIVAKIVTAAEAKKPRLRYVAPLYQSLFVRIMRMLGK
jgi:short-subunit dehydrogenase